VAVNLKRRKKSTTVGKEGITGSMTSPSAAATLANGIRKSLLYSTPYYSCSIVTKTSTLSLTTSCCLSRPKYSESKIALNRWSQAWPRLSEHQCTKNQMPHSYSGVRSQPDSTHEPLAINRDHCSLSHPTERVRRHQALRKGHPHTFFLIQVVTFVAHLCCALSTARYP
jgi:hypothetical protein